MTITPRQAHAFTLGPFLQDVATIYTSIDEISAQKVLSIACLPQGEILIGTERGLWRFHPGRLEVQNLRLPESQGVRWIRRGVSDRIWFGTMQNSCHLIINWTIQATDQVPDETIDICLDPNSAQPRF